MDVTRSNFQELLPDIAGAISSADFMCVDGEFTGLRTGDAVNAFDTPSEYYQKVVSGSSDFLLVQFGLCTFRWDKESKTFRHCAFNFYLFPRPQHQHAPDKIFSCQSSSMDFLAAQKFDFNKLFYEGISYLSTLEELKMREQLEEKCTYERSLLNDNGDTKNSREPPIVIPAEHTKQIDDLCLQVKAFLKNDDEEKLEFPNLNPFVRKLVYQELEKHFNNKLFLETTLIENQKRILCVSKALTKEEMAKKVEDKIVKQWKDLETAVGFSQVIRKISESGKLVIGHSLLLDLIHILNQFFSPLPDSYEEFKEFANSSFPRIIDTMYLASLPDFRETITSLNLANLLTVLSEDPFKIPSIKPESGENLKGYVLSGSKYHEAGYDAFTTGLCFLSIVEHLARKQHLTLDKVQLNADSKILKPFMNKIFLFKTSPQGSPFINLSGKDMNPSRDHVFYMTFPVDWKRNEIFELFSPFGGVFVSFIDDTSAYVALRRKDQVNFALTRLGRQNSMFTLTSFLKHKASLLKMESQNQAGGQGNQKGMVSKRKRNPSEPSGSNDLPKEDLGQPIPRDASCPASSLNDAKRRRTVSATSSDGAATPRRRRTSSGLFTVTETAEEVTKTNEKRLFNEDNDWE